MTKLVPESVSESVNRYVNENTTYLSDLENYGIPECWCYPKEGRDDCDGYALLKWHLLREQGFAENTHLATCEIGGSGHAVCIVKNEDGVMRVLDNCFPFPMEKSQLPYKWHEIEINGQWYDLK